MSGVPEEVRPVVTEVLARLVAEDAEGLKRDGIDPYPDNDLFLWVREYGARLVAQPNTLWEQPHGSAIPLADGTGWAVVLDLWTEDESPSDLTLELFVYRRPSGYRVQITGLHVL